MRRKHPDRRMPATEVTEWLRYDPSTGLLIWVQMSSTKCPIGRPAGYDEGNGYRYVRLRGELYPVHWIAWACMTGEWPKDEIDHINGVKDDNRWSNLREATRSQNACNIRGPRSHNASGVKGVWWCSSKNKWRSAVRAQGKAVHLGYFNSVPEAAEAYRKAAPVLQGEFARTE